MQKPTERPHRSLLIVTAAVLLLLGACDGSGDAPTTDQPSVATGTDPEEAPELTARDVAGGFFEAFGAFDPDRAIDYLAEDAEISALLIGTESVEGAEAELRLNLSMLEAQGYEQQPGSCEETGTLASGIRVRCLFDFHLFGSDEIGLGPYTGSYFDVTVRDGAITRGSVSYEIEEFSPEMWEPFAALVSATHPADAAVMYTDGSYTGVLISEESIRLWGRHVPEYVVEAAG